MSLRARLSLAIVALVAVTLLLVGRIHQDRVIRPFAGEVFAAFIDQAVYTADQVDAGADPAKLGAALRLEVRRVDDPAEGAASGWRRGRGDPPAAVVQRWERRGLRHVTRGDRALAFPPGPRDVLYVQLDDGWLEVRRGLDLDRPRRMMTRVMLGVGAVVVALASLLAAWSVRPLETTRKAMEQVAAGDLSVRIPAQGAPELAAVARAFNQMTERVESQLRAEKELLAGVSHELRSPLTRMRLSLELLRDAGADDRRITALEADIGELDALVGEMVGWSKLQLGEGVLQPEPTDLAAFAAEIVAREAPGTAVEGAGEAPIDRKLVARALGNLLSNAARHGGGALRVLVSPSGFVVEDAGPGVEEADLTRLFEPFFRADRSRARTTGGLGLGLLIVRQVARLHGGEATARLRPDGGLAVDLRLRA